MSLRERLARKRSGEVPIEKLDAMAKGAKCNDCPYKQRPIVPTWVPENETDKCIIGIAPHTEEVRTGVPFVGASGRVLNHVLHNVGYERNDFVITNICLCQPAGTTEVTSDAVECCTPRLENELIENGIRTMVSLGADPLKLLTGNKQAKFAHVLNIKQNSIFHLIDLIPTYHPAYTLRGSPDAINEIEAAFKVLKSGLPTKPDFEVCLIDNQYMLKGFVKLATETFINYDCVVDLETSNSDLVRSTPDQWYYGVILACAFYFGKDSNTAYVIPDTVLYQVETRELLRPMFERDKGVIGHNVKFDIKYLIQYYNYDIDIKIADDTLLMSYVIDERPGTKGYQRHSLKKLAALLGDPNYDDVFDKYLVTQKVDGVTIPKSDCTYNKIPRDMLYEYVAKDVVYTYHLLMHFRQLLDENDLDEWPYRNMLIPALEVLLQCELGGMYIDGERLQNAKDYMEHQIDVIKTELRNLCGNPNLNPNSPKQLSVEIYETFGLGKGKIKKGTGVEVIEALQELHPDSSFLGLILEYRKHNKILTTYLNKIPNYCDSRGQFHATYNPAGTLTGRVSGGMALTIPGDDKPEGRMVRSAFVVPPNEDVLPPYMETGKYKLIDADYSQAELRWLAFLSQDPFLYDVYERDLDLHDETARVAYGDDFTDFQRRISKNLNFAFAYDGSEYQMVAAGLMSAAGGKAAMERHEQTLQRAVEWKGEIWESVKENGYIESVTGRLRRFPLITDRLERDLRRQAVNFPIQSIASDCTLLAFHNLWERLRDKPVYPTLFLHDGIYFLVRDDNDFIDRVCFLIQSIMENTAYLLQQQARHKGIVPADAKSLPFKSDIKIKDSWA